MVKRTNNLSMERKMVFIGVKGPHQGDNSKRSLEMWGLSKDVGEWVYKGGESMKDKSNKHFALVFLKTKASKIVYVFKNNSSYEVASFGTVKRWLMNLNYCTVFVIPYNLPPWTLLGQVGKSKDNLKACLDLEKWDVFNMRCDNDDNNHVSSSCTIPNLDRVGVDVDEVVDGRLVIEFEEEIDEDEDEVD
ncbi:hypothetical protein Tco_0760750 [Tanacetum coccineum]